MITTWLDEQEKTKYSCVADLELNSLFQEIRQKIPNRYYIQERDFGTKKWPWSTRAKNIRYELYVDNGHEAQVFTFGPGMNTYADQNTICVYFYGVINGLKHNDKP